MALGFSVTSVTQVSAIEIYDRFTSPKYFFSITEPDPQEIEEQQTGLQGDINGDGIIDVNDFKEIKNIVLNGDTYSLQADLNGDGKVNSYDTVILKNIVIKDEEDDTVRVCLDAGHYGLYNQSPGVKAYYESNMTWKLHLYLKEELESYGIEVITTRENQETDRGLVSRGQASAGCDLFLSIHSNAVGYYMKEDTDFPVAIALLPDDSTNIDEISNEIGKLLADTTTEVMQTTQKGYVWTRLSEDDRNEDGELNDEWYGVLFGAKSVGTPAILMEHSFHTNTRSALWLLEDENLKKLAKAEAEQIANYFNSQRVAASNSPTEYEY